VIHPLSIADAVVSRRIVIRPAASAAAPGGLRQRVAAQGEAALRADDRGIGHLRPAVGALDQRHDGIWMM